MPNFFTHYSYGVTTGVALLAAFNVVERAYDRLANGHWEHRPSNKQFRREAEQNTKAMYEYGLRCMDEYVESNRKFLEYLRLEKEVNEVFKHMVNESIVKKLDDV